MSITLAVSGGSASGQIVQRQCGSFPVSLTVSSAGQIGGSMTTTDGSPQTCSTTTFNVSGKLVSGTIELELRGPGASGRGSLRKG